jgi:hypothetical protein
MGLFCSLPPKHLLLNPSNQPKKKVADAHR